ncbi:phospholipase effector Tle1 domain-containing protein [Raoultella planticola]|uniref:phospholipase effector Tle1 domain-containing protein n=1 Tax=Raoultella planticola TaxID=575 RepID=UPI0034DD2B96
MNLLVFCDGTWNTPQQLDDGKPAPTNVVKLRNAVAENTQQRVYYHSGVGTDGGVVDRYIGGGIGEGLDKNIISAYYWLATRYQPGDKIWLFGFSRGAYTVRSLNSCAE